MFVLSFLTSLFSFLLKLSTWTALLALPLGIAYFFYLKHRSKYFQRLGLPQPPITSYFLGNLEEFERNQKQHEKLVEWHKKYGITFGMLQGAHRVIVTSDVNIINEVYVKQFHSFQSRQLHASMAIDQKNGPNLNVFFGEGNQWKRLRALFSASLTISKIKSVDPIMKRAHDELVQALKKHENQVIDIIPNILDLTFAVISRSAMGIDDEFGKSAFLQQVLQLFGTKDTAKHFIPSFFAGTYDFLFITKYLQFLTIFTALKFAIQMGSMIDKAITVRENETSDEKAKRHQDFMDFLREAQEDNLDTTNKSDMDIKISKKLTRSELIGSAQTFLIGGADTTATLIDYCLYEIAMHPEYEKIILQEIDDFIISEDDINYNKIKDLEFLDRFVKETARLHPFAFTATPRRAIETVTLKCSDGTFLRIDKGTCILPNIPVISVDKNVWGKDATEFNPDRFLPENNTNRHPMAWLPFGAGPRICPGKNLAMHETKATIVRLLKEFKFEICNKTELNEITRSLMGFESLKMKILPRKM
uniref:Cytochrome P450 n=1 Tax=Panagrolaimus sp. PS1159 TaxID=55785 RepID=A0AC35F960_9BILA